MIKARKLLAAATVLTTALSVPWMLHAGEVHVWKDAEGRTHYSDVPPPNTDAKKVEITVPASSGGSGVGSGTSAPRKSLAEREEDFRKRLAERKEKASKQEDEAKRQAELKAQCADARRQLEALDAGRRVAKYNEKGERIILDDDQRKAEADKIRSRLKKHCEKK